jgi:hypothetical protein
MNPPSTATRRVIAKRFIEVASMIKAAQKRRQ